MLLQTPQLRPKSLPATAGEAGRFTRGLHPVPRFGVWHHPLQH